MSKIQWTEETWNPTLGCSKVSAGCQNCYAIRTVHRLAGNPNQKVAVANAGLTERRGDRIEWTGKVNFIPDRLTKPLSRRKPTMWFVNSLSDLFHPEITDEQRDMVFAIAALTPQHTYQILTKREGNALRYCSDENVAERIAKRAFEMAPKGWDKCVSAPNGWPFPNVWLGVSVENQQAVSDRAEPLFRLHNRGWKTFYSCEPLLENVELYLNHERADWVIAGGESGPNARPCNSAWLRSLKEQCQAAGVPFFLKQFGSNRILDFPDQLNRKGDDPTEWPEEFRVRQMPVAS